MPRQTEIPGTEVPGKNADIEESLDAWLEAKEEQRRAADTTKIRHASLLEQMANAGIDRYPFVDRTTGKKRQVVIAKDPKARTMNAPRRERDDAADDVNMPENDSRVILGPAEPAADTKVETRRVKRTKAHDAVVDPFGATRGLLEQAEAQHGAAKEE